MTKAVERALAMQKKKTAITAAMDRSDAWKAVYDYESETNLDAISTGVKKAVRDMIDSAINPE